MKEKKIKRLICVLACCLSLFAGVLICLNTNGVYAALTDNGEETAAEDSQEVQPRWTDLSLSIDCGDGRVWATVKNDFTLFYSTVKVIVMLYSSETYAESYTEMTLENNNQTEDLDMGKTISTVVYTNGVEKFWLARMRYKINSGEWQSKETAACRISGSGEFLGYV